MKENPYLYVYFIITFKPHFPKFIYFHMPKNINNLWTIKDKYGDCKNKMDI